MQIEWTDDLRTAVPAIDEQHKELFRRLKALFDSCAQGTGSHEVGRMIAFLGDYIVRHFEAEEQQMVSARFPLYEKHKSEHQDFVGEVQDLTRKYLAEGGGVHVVLLTVRTSVEWLSSHIRKTDREMAEFLKSRQQV